MIHDNLSQTSEKVENSLWEGRNFLFPVLGSFLLAMWLPIIIIWLTNPNGLVFNGALINITDLNVYLSAIRQGSEGHWLFNPQFTPHVIPPYLSYLPYIIMGKFKSLFGGSTLFWYEMFRLISWSLAIIAIVNLIKTVLPGMIRIQKTAFLLILFSSGIGWLIIIGTKALTLITPDLFVPELTMMTSSYAAPHFLLGIALQASFFSSIHRFLSQNSPKQGTKLFLISIGISLVYPFQIIVNGSTLAVYFVVQSLETKRIKWKQIAKTIALLLPFIGFLYYYGIFLPQNQLYREMIINRNQIEPPPLIGLIVGFGFLLPMTFLGLPLWLKQNNSKIIAVWLPVNFICIFLPVSFSGRFLLGMFIPIALIAAFGLEIKVIPQITSAIQIKAKSLRNIIIGLTLPSTMFFVFYLFMVNETFTSFPYYNRSEDVAAVQWLGERTTDQDLVLGSFPLNNLLPRYGKGRVFYGHFVLTDDMEARFEIMEKFWDPQTPDSWRQAFIDEWGFTYLYQGYYENALSREDPLEFPYEIIYSTEEVIIYRLP